MPTRVPTKPRTRTDNKEAQQIPAPTYTIEEDKEGNLTNWKYRLIWPQRPKSGRYSLNADVEVSVQRRQPQQREKQQQEEEEKTLIREKQQKEEGKKTLFRPFDSRISVNEDGDETVATSFKMKFPNDKNVTEFRVRAVKTETVNKYFHQYQIRSLVLYYRMPNLTGKRKTISAIPLNLPLMVASSSGLPNSTKIVHSEVQRFSHKNDKGGEDYLWCLAKLGPDGEPEKLAGGEYRLGFSDMRTLLENYVKMSA